MTFDEIVARMNAVKDGLIEKGYECPSIEWGAKVLGNYGLVFWATLHLGSPDNHMKNAYDTARTIDAVMDKFEASAAAVPPKASADKAKADALGKLSADERKMLGIRA